MLPHTLSFNPSAIPTASFSSNFPSNPLKTALFYNFRRHPFPKSYLGSPKCSLAVVEGQRKEGSVEARATRPSSAEVSRTIVELRSQGTLSALSQEGWPLGMGVRFAVDGEGTPVLGLNPVNQGNPIFSTNDRSSLHVQLEHNGSCTPQCTLQGSLSRPEDKVLKKRLLSVCWKKFEKEINKDFLYVMTVDKVLHMEDFKEEGIWVPGAEYKNASPDPLRTCAKRIVDEMNNKYVEDIGRFWSTFVDVEFQVVEAKMIWVDRLGFDLNLVSSDEDVFMVRIPFPREVTDEKAAKSSLTYLSQLAWELERNYTAPEFERVKCLKKVSR